MLAGREHRGGVLLLAGGPRAGVNGATQAVLARLASAYMQSLL